MKKSKQANASERENGSECEDGVDMISNLPDPILQMILSGLPTTEEVIRTSIFSTRWKHLWTLIPSIDIDCSRGLNFNRNKFRNFVHHVLASSSLDLDSFRLSCSDHYNMETIQRWIHAAVARNIKQLHLLFCCGHWFQSIELPHRLVTCGSLEVLRLNLYKRRLVLPTVAGFPSLRVLELNNVVLYKVNNFLESCPLLEDLSLIDCAIFRLKVLCISCPKLKSLRLDNRNISDYEEMYDVDNVCGRIRIICPKLEYFEFGALKARSLKFKSLDSLKKAVIHPEEFPSEFENYMFNGITYIESLSTSIDIFCFSLWLSVEPPSVPKFKTLELSTTHTPIMGDLTRFLTFLPHLESLHLIIDEEYLDWEDWKLDEAETRSILTCHLKSVQFLNYNKTKLILDIARSLLEHGNVLEEMVFRWDCDEAEFHEMSMETMKEVSKFQKASSTYKNADVPVFLPNLKTLELTMGFDEDNIDELIQILACFPHLESLQLNIEASYYSWDLSEMEEAETMRILTSHLKRVEFLSFNCKGPTQYTTGLILEHANALEEMVFRLDCDEANFHRKSTETMKEVSNFQKASLTVKLVTLLKKK